MSNSIVKFPTSGLSELDQKIIDEVLAQEYTNKTNQEIAGELGISLSTFYRKKREPAIQKAIVNQSKDNALLLMPLAVAEAKKLLTDNSTSPTAKTKLIQLIFTATGVTKAEMTSMTAKEYFKEDTEISIDELMESYGIKQKTA